MKKILFNDKFSLTEAVLSGRKTQTRRICPDGTPLGNWVETVKKSRYQVGEVVAVAQSYHSFYNEECDPRIFPDGAGWLNKMFVTAGLMPYHIRITDVRVERLQDISDEDCMAEGIDYVNGYSESYFFGFGVKSDKGWIRLGNTPREAYAALIDRISGKGTWDSNPYVFVYTFELIK